MLRQDTLAIQRRSRWRCRRDQGWRRSCLRVLRRCHCCQCAHPTTPRESQSRQRLWLGAIGCTLRLRWRRTRSRAPLQLRSPARRRRHNLPGRARPARPRGSSPRQRQGQAPVARSLRSKRRSRWNQAPLRWASLAFHISPSSLLRQSSQTTKAGPCRHKPRPCSLPVSCGRDGNAVRVENASARAHACSEDVGEHAVAGLVLPGHEEARPVKGNRRSTLLGRRR